ncbi:flagellar motor switch protein FliM [Primorskyibacter flagellatus]|uniref:Flagellar motor switch protein FliM n=1 Tax=Primorskyibacter flagellatus TaxID=1387277 RepID=A0A1W2EPT8_9RHOB|nr:flagellar motor switch protein FliM [Primorskyibacter flagellatus]SMD11691.1 flagellar motor switch protein FliM [Primorskyibacter flagellatus]
MSEDMTGQVVNEVLSKKANAARREQEARVLSPARALRRALSRSADALWGLAIVADGMQQETLVLDVCLDGVPHDALVMVLDGLDGVTGAVVLDRATVRSVIEVQTLGRVTSQPLDQRPLTQTDAAMCAPLLDAMLGRLSANLEGHPAQGEYTGYRFGAMVEDTRALGVLMDAAEFHSFLVSVEIGDGLRRGEILLILPVLPKPEPATRPDPPRDPLSAKNAGRMQMVEARIEAVLSRIRMPLSAASRLKPGNLLPLPENVLNQVELSAGGVHIANGCRLGQMGGFRAVRVTFPASSKTTGPRVEAETEQVKAVKNPAKAMAIASPKPVVDEPVDIPDLPEIPGIDDFSDLSSDPGAELNIDDDLLTLN